MQLLVEKPKEVSRCMWCGKKNVELNHQYILPICDSCQEDFKNR